MSLKSFRIEPDLWERAQAKAGLTPLSAIIRELLRMWLDGDITIKK